MAVSVSVSESVAVRVSVSVAVSVSVTVRVSVAEHVRKVWKKRRLHYRMRGGEKRRFGYDHFANGEI